MGFEADKAFAAEKQALDLVCVAGVCRPCVCIVGGSGSGSGASRRACSCAPECHAGERVPAVQDAARSMWLGAWASAWPLRGFWLTQVLPAHHALALASHLTAGGAPVEAGGERGAGGGTAQAAAGVQELSRRSESDSRVAAGMGGRGGAGPGGNSCLKLLMWGGIPGASCGAVCWYTAPCEVLWNS